MEPISTSCGKNAYFLNVEADDEYSKDFVLIG
jgi:hypothetical protein